ncbi:MAG: PAS domain-containing protein, partial [Candidatus Tectomicrobia bacterium]|nr:PAS domain-containing protein [Candidatus Tectomicrobia bacterium]
STSLLSMAHSAHTELLHPEEESRSVIETLRAHAAYYTTLLAQTDFMVYTCNMSSELVAFNQTCESFLGYNREELCGKHAWELLTASSRDISSQMRVRKMEGIPVTSYRVMALTKHQQSVAVDVTTQLIYRFSQPIGIQGLARRHRT